MIEVQWAAWCSLPSHGRLESPAPHQQFGHGRLRLGVQLAKNEFGLRGFSTVF
jgi:hypothetical protein